MKRWFLLLAAVVMLWLSQILFGPGRAPDDLMVQLAASAEPGRIDAWSGSPLEYRFLADPGEGVRTGEPIYAGAAVQGFGADRNGFADLSADLQLFGPDGRVIYRVQNAMFSRQVVDPVDPGYIRLKPAVALSVPDLLPGDYRLQVEVHDHVRDRAQTHEVALRLDEP